MGLALTQVVTEDRASGGQVIDGSLRFDSSKNNYLNRTPGSAGNRRTWTWSGWFKTSVVSAPAGVLLGATDGTNQTNIYVGDGTNPTLRLNFQGNGDVITTAFYRDPSAWYHLVVAVDTTQATASNRVKFYANGSQITAFSTADYPTQNLDTAINGTFAHYIGGRVWNTDQYFDGYLVEVNFIDGQALDASSFGFTDPLTNTWRPKKYTGTYGTNGFWLPMDGNSPIGEDKSGNGNNWTPGNFGGSTEIDKADALPILNTIGGSKVATVGVRTDTFASNLVLALPFIDTDEYTNEINSAQANIITGFTNNGATYTSPPVATSHTVPYGAANALQLNSSGGTDYDYYRPTFAAGTLNFLHNQTGSGTVEFWFRHAGYNSEAVIWGTSNGSGNVGMSAYMTSQTQFAVFISKGTSGTNLGATGNISLPQNEWHHIAITKSTSEVRVYIDGVFESNFTFTAGDASNSNSTNNYLQMGQNSGEQATRGWNDSAYYRDFRIYNTVKYTGNFRVVSSNPDILPDTPSGVAGGSALTKVTDGAVAFDGTNDGLTISDDADFDLGTNDFTIEGYYYLENAGTYQCLFDWRGGTNGVYPAMFRNDTGDYIYYFVDSARRIDNISITYKKWFHLALCRSSGTTRLFIDGVEKGSFADSFNYISNDIKLGLSPGDTNDLTGFISNYRVVNGTALYTSNFTPPTAPLTNVTNTKLLCCQSTTSAGEAEIAPAIANNPNDGSIWSQVGTRSGTIIDWTSGFDGSRSTQTSNSSNTAAVITFNPVIPCSTATIWGNTGGSTARILINGTSVGGDGQNANPLKQLNTVDVSAQGGVQTISLQGTSDGYAAKMGALICNPGAGEVDAVNGAKQIFPVGNAAATNFNPFTTDINTVRGQESGYATLNPVARERAGGGLQRSSVTLTNGNLSASNTADSGVRATMAVSSGKWYYEATKTSSVQHSDGVGWESYGVPDDSYYAYYRDNGADKVDNVNSSAGTWATFTNGDVIGAALDLDANTITFYKNGILVFSKTANTSATEPWGPGIILRYSGGSGAASSFDVNFGQKPFKYNPPEGHKTLCLANLPRPTEAAVRPDKYFNTVLWTGDGTDGRSITGLGFKPDFVWIKNRTDGTRSHLLYDVVRPISTQLSSDANSAEVYVADRFDSFDSDGFTGGNLINTDTKNFVAWCWKAGGAAVSNTDGSITSQVSANRDAGFSIVTYTGNGSTGTVGHGLNDAPNMILCKNRDGTDQWFVYHDSLDVSSNKALRLNSTLAAYGASPAGINAASSSTFTLGGDRAETNTNDQDYIAYCWHSVSGFSKFGSYTGNDNADGPFVYTGFKPAWIMVKSYSSGHAYNWVIVDAARNTYNVMGNQLFPNLNNQESTGEPSTVDFLSNGFKFRAGGNGHNGPSVSYIFAAFAEAPTNNLFGGQANAR